MLYSNIRIYFEGPFSGPLLSRLYVCFIRKRLSILRTVYVRIYRDKNIVLLKGLNKFRKVAAEKLLRNSRHFFGDELKAPNGKCI